MMIRGYEIGARLIAMIVGVILLIVAVSLFLTQCQSNKHLKKQNEVSGGQAGAAIDSGAVAMNIVSNVATGDAATDEAVAAGQLEIARAAKGQKGAAAKRAACRLKAYANTPQCKEPTP
jgi:hypothetical protein